MPRQNLKNSFLVKMSGIACIISLIVFIFLLFATTPNQKQAKASSYNTDQILVAVNKERSNKNVKPLVLNDQLNKAALSKATDMSQKNYFSHISPIDGKKWSEFIKDSEYDYAIAGENLANGFDTVKPMIEAWMNSPAHRENLLNEQFSETGLGIVYGKLNKNPTIFVVQVFGTQNKDNQELKIKESKIEPENKEQKSNNQNNSPDNFQNNQNNSEIPKNANLGQLMKLPSIKPQ